MSKHRRIKEKLWQIYNNAQFGRKCLFISVDDSCESDNKESHRLFNISGEDGKTQKYTINEVENIIKRGVSIEGLYRRNKHRFITKEMLYSTPFNETEIKNVCSELDSKFDTIDLPYTDDLGKYCVELDWVYVKTEPINSDEVITLPFTDNKCFIRCIDNNIIIDSGECKKVITAYNKPYTVSFGFLPYASTMAIIIKEDSQSFVIPINSISVKEILVGDRDTYIEPIHNIYSETEKSYIQSQTIYSITSRLLNKFMIDVIRESKARYGQHEDYDIKSIQFVFSASLNEFLVHDAIILDSASTKSIYASCIDKDVTIYVPADYLKINGDVRGIFYEISSESIDLDTDNIIFNKKHLDGLFTGSKFKNIQLSSEFGKSAETVWGMFKDAHIENIELPVDFGIRLQYAQSVFTRAKIKHIKLTKCVANKFSDMKELIEKGDTHTDVY